jgi:hypothetical protein
MKTLLEFCYRLPKRINGRIRNLLPYQLRPILLEWKTSIAFLIPHHVKPHGLSSPLIVSLTSYPARFSKLPLTLKSLLTQSVASDRVILWIANQDKNALTPAILRLQKSGLEIAYCDDLRSYKKIIPTLRDFPDHFIATADDDVYYWPSWLEELVSGYQQNAKNVIFHRGHRILLGKDGLPLPYAMWEKATQRKDTSPLNFQVGIGGVLYPPNVFHADVLNVEAFTKLCPLADDIWLYWMMRLNGSMARCASTPRYIQTWKNTQHISLYRYNLLSGGNDLQIQAMIKAYGFPSESYQC